MKLGLLYARIIFLIRAKFFSIRLMVWWFSGAEISFTKQLRQTSFPSNSKIGKFTSSKICFERLLPNVWVEIFWVPTAFNFSWWLHGFDLLGWNSKSVQPVPDFTYNYIEKLIIPARRNIFYKVFPPSISLRKPIDSHWFKIFLLELFSLQLCLFCLRKMRKSYKNIVLTDWCDMLRKNTIEISSIYRNVLLWSFSNSCVSYLQINFFLSRLGEMKQLHGKFSSQHTGILALQKREPVFPGWNF